MSENTTTTTTTTLEDKVNEALGDATEFTPYAIALTVNELFEALGADKRIPTQMAYNYCNNGLIKGVTTRTVATKKEGGSRTAKFVSREGALEWIMKYVSKNVTQN